MGIGELRAFDREDDAKKINSPWVFQKISSFREKSGYPSMRGKLVGKA
ncbi:MULTISPECIES: hypothetical protein [Pseudomonas]|nr:MULTISPECIES: hypothetical protein [Pseudomonas]MCA5968542.1 hypothetical protein [Pseudomonas sp. P129]